MIDKLTEDVAVHQTLGDEPNAENGLTADDLKRRFDQPAEAIKKYINEILVPNAVDKRGDSMSGELNMGGNALYGLAAPVLDDQAAHKGYVDSRIRFTLEDQEPEDLLDGQMWLTPLAEGDAND